MITSLPSGSINPVITSDRPSQAASGGVAARSSDTRDNQASQNNRPDANGQVGTARNSAQLSDADLQRVRELQQRDREVRAHELAHVAAGAGLILRGASFTYETGPDGQRYAVGGEVTIDTSPGRTPEETLSKAGRIKAAALAPADPSPQDRQVASQADMMAAEARVELAQQLRAESAGAGGEAAQPGTDSGSNTERDAAEQRMRAAYADAAIAGSGLRDQTFSAYA